jgi:hypothetical protein
MIIDLNSYLTPEMLALIHRFRHEREAPDWPSHVYMHAVERANMLFWDCLATVTEDGEVRWK